MLSFRYLHLGLRLHPPSARVDHNDLRARAEPHAALHDPEALQRKDGGLQAYSSAQLPSRPMARNGGLLRAAGTSFDLTESEPRLSIGEVRF